MDSDELIEIDDFVQEGLWAYEYVEARRNNKILTWVSSLHRDHLPCQYAHESPGDEEFGSFNWNCQVTFTNRESWMVRFPRGGHVSLPDEKVENEVAVMLLLRQQTAIPVPKIMAWGLSKDNPLGLGPFIMTEYVPGISLGKVLKDPEKDYRIMGDVSNDKLEKIFRQVCRFQLMLAQLDFPRIGGLTWNSETNTTDVNRRPLTFKAHEILHGGCNILCSSATTFSSAAEYFRYVARGDRTHLFKQRNSIDDSADAALKYRYWNVACHLAPQMALPKYNNGPFKLICDDFTPANMIVNNAEDLEIVAVLDWEWSYAGPKQVFWSPPFWLILSPPRNWEECDERLERYESNLVIYQNVLEEEEKAFGYNSEQEEKAFGYNSEIHDTPSAMVRQAKESGRAWFHHIIQRGFNGPMNVPFYKFKELWESFASLADMIPLWEVDKFVKTKMEELEVYKSDLAKEIEELPDGPLKDKFSKT